MQPFIIGDSELHETGRVPPRELFQAHVVSFRKTVVIPCGGEQVDGVPHYGEIEGSATEYGLGLAVVPSNEQR